MIKNGIVGIILLFTLFEVNGQNDLTNWSKKFDNYQAVWPKVKLHLIFNQPKYAPGDTTYFKVYFLNEANLLGVKGNQLINFNLIDCKGESKAHSVFSIEDGVGWNQFIIPSDLPSGAYYFTAFSSWMKNFDPSFFFKKEVTIVKDKTTLLVKQNDLEVAVEGGSLINGVVNNIIVRTGLPNTDLLVFKGKSEILKLQSSISGLTSFTLIPEAGFSYSVQLVGSSELMPLPNSSNGCSMHVKSSKVKDKAVKIIFSSPPSSALRNESLSLIISARGKIHYATSFTQGLTESVEIEIDQTKFPEGIMHASLLNSKGLSIADRDFYSPAVDIITAEIKIINDKFQTNEKVKLDISLTDSNGQPVNGEFGINILNASLFPEKQGNILSDELSIIRNVNKELVIDRTDSTWFKDLDNHLVLHTEPVPWKNILSNKIPTPAYGFTSVLQKNGTVYFNDVAEPVPDLTQVMFYLQKKKWFYQTFTIDKGKISLTLPEVFDQDEFFYFARSKGNEILNIKIVWDEEPVKFLPAPQFNETSYPDSYFSFTNNKRLIDQSFDAAVQKKQIMKAENDEPDFESIITKADVIMNLQDYIIFQTMEELIQEIIPSLYFRKSAGKNIVRVQSPEPMKITSDPVYVIDGIITRNTDLFLSLKPADLLNIKIVWTAKKLIPLGLLGKNGIVIVNTKTQDAREPLDDSTKLIEGLSKPISFKSDQNPDPNSNNPKFRSTIYWNPMIKTDSNGQATVEFLTTDDIGKLKIRIDGMSAAKPFSAEREIEVSLRTKE